MIPVPCPRPLPAAITGMGAFTPFGQGVGRFIEAVFQGRHGFGTITVFEAGKHRTSVGAQAPDPPQTLWKRPAAGMLSRADRFALAAAREALQQAGLLDPERDQVFEPKRTGVIVGTAAGGILGLEAFFRKRASGEPVSSPRSLLSSFALSSLAANLAKAFDLQGPRLTTATVCSSSALALAAGRELIESGRVDRILVVGSESLSEVTHAGFNTLRSVAPDRCRPFDLHRRGLILGEGAGAVVMESVEAARFRGAEPIGFLAGCGITTDIHHFTAPQPQGDAVARAMEAALREGGVEAAEVGHINAHGTGTRLNDRAEARGIRRLFGSLAPELPVFSIKSIIGHQLGAAGILEAIVTLAVLQSGRVPRAAGLETPDPECDLCHSTGEVPERPLQYGLSNSLAFGGSDVSLLFSRNAVTAGTEGKPAGKEFSVPVITGMGVVSPLGIGRRDFAEALHRGQTGLRDLGFLGSEWSSLQGGVIDNRRLKECVPSAQRRRMNRPATFLFAAFREALEDAGMLRDFGTAKSAVTYGSAYGCSGSVHAFYSGLLEDGPALGSPHEFSLSVTNSPPSLITQIFELTSPVWVFVADEASWDISLHWACDLIQGGRAEVVAVCGAEELSGSIVAIHSALGFLREPGRDDGLVLGEGAVCMIVESEARALERGASVYGSVQGWQAAGDARCGPLDYPPDGAPLLKAAAACLERNPGDGILVCISPENGNPRVDRAAAEVLKGIHTRIQGGMGLLAFKPLLGESGIASGLGLAAALLGPDVKPGESVLCLTCARAGVHAATVVKRRPRGPSVPSEEDHD